MSTDAVAITGLDCRFPAARDAHGFWELLTRSGDGIRPVPPQRWDPHVSGGPAEGGFLADADAFDNGFFTVSPREAASMDPQQRLMLQSAWRAVEDSGTAPHRLAGSATGVFVGVMGSEWAQLTMTDLPGITPQIGSGNGYCMIANRISYHLDLKGPCLAVDTACSSSLVAVHLAANALLSGECDRAIAGGVNIALTPALGLFYERAGLAAPDGRCKPFSAGADGIGRGEGVGTVVLRRLADAVAEGEPVYAVIRGTAVNQDGRSNGITAPSRWSQQEVLAAAYRRAGVEPFDVAFTEGHGTGTALGDMIEVKALGRLHAGRARPMALGSVKGNIGHTEGAAGIAGLIKVALSLHHRTVPVSRFAARENVRLRLAEHGVRLLKAPLRLPAGQPVLAGLSSFGMGGTNAHAVLESAPARRPSDRRTSRPADATSRPVDVSSHPSDVTPHPVDATSDPGFPGTGLGAPVFVLTAPDGPALRRNLLAQAEAIGRRPLPIGPLCRASHRVKDGHAHRGAIVAADSAELAARLREEAARLSRTAVSPADLSPTGAPQVELPQTGMPQVDLQTGTPQVELEQTVLSEAEAAKGPAAPRSGAPGEAQVTAWLFTGQGSQYPKMGARLYRESSLFRRHLDAADAALAPHTGGSVVDLLFGGDSAVHRTGWAQPALFAVGHALGATLTEVGIRPGLLLGHSVGEYAAAVLAGALTLENAARLVAARGALMEQLPDGGGMLAVQAPAARLRELVEREPLVGFAALNGPEATVLSGDLGALERIAASPALDGIRTRRLPVSHAFHSPLMQPVLEPFRRIAEECAGHAPTLPFYSTLRGKRLESEPLDAAYWTEHISAPVLFADAAAQLLDERPGQLLELGPGPVLTGLVRRLGDRPTGAEALHPLPGEHGGGRELAEVVAALYRSGAEVHWAAAHPADDAPAVRLAPYAFSTETRYWRSGAPRPSAADPRTAESASATRRARRATQDTEPVPPAVQDRDAPPLVPETGPLAASRPADRAEPEATDGPGLGLAPGSGPPDPDPGQDAVSSAVLEAVAHIGGFAAGDLSERSRFHEDLGLDSVALIELKARLEERLPALAHVPVQDLLPRLTSVGELISYLRQETAL
ncbi:type I polyketide synthase [Streptomyces sp. NPDC002577]